jgi:hypothetical protein
MVRCRVSKAVRGDEQIVIPRLDFIEIIHMCDCRKEVFDLLVEFRVKILAYDPRATRSI